MARTASLQKADDPARHLRNIWLGTDLGRWPFEARFSAWGSAIALSCAAFLIYWLAVPFVVVVVALAYVGAVTVGKLYGSMLRWASFGAVLLFVLLAVPGLVVSLLPMPFWLALPFGIVTGVMITRKVMRHVDENRPVGYWRWLLPTIASGPRPHREPLVFAPSEPPLPEPYDLRPLQVAGLAFNEGVPPMKFRTSATFEAFRWRPENEEKAAAFQAWLSGYGYEFVVNSGNAVSIMDPKSMIEVTVMPGNHAVFEVDDKDKPCSPVQALPHPIFKEQFTALDCCEEPELGDDVVNVGDPIKVGHNLGVEPPYVDCTVTDISSDEDGLFLLTAQRDEADVDIHNPPPPPA